MEAARRISYKALRKLCLLGVSRLAYVDTRLYMRCYIPVLRFFGLRIYGIPRYIAPTCSFDGTDYGLISIGHDAVISGYVRILTHDYALTRAFVALGIELPADVSRAEPVTIGENCFVGTRSILMPGCSIGKNVIIGAGSVVRGIIPDDSVVIGNPAQIVGNTLDWARSRIELLRQGRLRPDATRRRPRSLSRGSSISSSHQGG
jgi:acetyltransferase-like isoleucine patch superfamily enzyme